MLKCGMTFMLSPTCELYKHANPYDIVVLTGKDSLVLRTPRVLRIQMQV